MDRSLKWRFLALFGIVVFCVATLASTFVDRDALPSWFGKVFSRKINLGLDLQGGMHIVYNIALDKAVDDKASEIKRDLESRFVEEKVPATVKTPQTTPTMPLGAVSVSIADAAKRAEIEKQIDSDYGEFTQKRDCTDVDGKDAICFQVSTKYADGIKKAALANAVNTIRDRIDEKGVAEPSVIEKGDDIIVELPGDPNDPIIGETEDIIARTAKLEFKVVDDGSAYMKNLYSHVADRKGKTIDPLAIADDVSADAETWTPEDGGSQHVDYYIYAHDREELLKVDEAKAIGCIGSSPTKDELAEGKRCKVTGRHVLERYLKNLVKADPTFKVPDERQIGYERNEPVAEAKDQRIIWRTYFLDRSVKLTGTAISNAYGNYDPNTNRPLVILDFNRFGGRVFGELTAQISGKKLATILDETVKSAPIINGAIRGGRASIQMGGSDAQRQEKERDELVNVLKTGSLPAPLVKASESKVGPTLGRDAIEKTRLSFLIGILLVVVIMVGVYRWSGWISVFAVVFHIIMTLAVMALFGATLTLPGIAAIVLSIGMEVDGNILIYERIRDELLLGKSVRGAIDLGFSRAFSAILDGQLTTAAAGWVLLQYGSGPIKGFAVMLLVGVFTTLTTNIWVTRIFFDWTVVRKRGHVQTISI